MDTMTYETLITDLQRKSAYDHPVDNITLRETHISWVFLTGEYVYKIKKPVDFGFLDFSTLEKRKFYCEEEVRLNSRLAPELYLAVVPVCGNSTPAHITPGCNETGQVIEYGVKMRQFDTSQEFDELLARGELGKQHMDETARVIAGFHANAAIADMHSPFGTPQAISEPVEENFQQINLLGNDWLETHQLAQPLRVLHQWSIEQKRKLEDLIISRKEKGFIRECHGDLHLRNIVIYNGKVTPFDGIEFNDNFRWIDVISELAFLLMDIDDHDRPDLSRRLLNDYLQLTGDYSGLGVLRYYEVYRAMVRAKVAGLQQLQTVDEDMNLSREVENYLNLATTYTRQSTPKMIITHGLSGSGKTYVSGEILEKTDIIRIRSDIERKRLFGLGETERDKSGIEQGIYARDASARTYSRLLELSEAIIEANFSVIVDAAFLGQSQRQAFYEFAMSRGVPFLILHCKSNMTVQRERLVTRRETGKDASDAGIEILQQQVNHHDPLTESEKAFTLVTDTTGKPDIHEVIEWCDTTQGN